MERKVWVRTKGSNLFPNLYIILVGPPGVGKSAILSHTERLLRAVPDIYVAPSSLTTASLIDTLEIALRKIVFPQLLIFNSLQVVASELGVFLPAYDPAFMNTLTKLYDGELYEERRRTGKVNHIRIDSPQLSIIGGTTPSYLNSFLPEGAWDQGFTSRTIFVFSPHAVYTPIFTEESDHSYLEEIFIGLLHDIKIIASTFGKVAWSQEAAEAITVWDREGLKPVPEHGKLAHYNSRRLAHVIKLCMVASVSRSQERVITLGDFLLAKGWLLEAENLMPAIFAQMGLGGDARVIEDLRFHILSLYGKNKKPVGEHRLVDFLKDRVPVQNISKIIEVMVRSKDLDQVLVNGIVCYQPGNKS